MEFFPLGIRFFNGRQLVKKLLFLLPLQLLLIAGLRQFVPYGCQVLHHKLFVRHLVDVFYFFAETNHFFFTLKELPISDVTYPFRNTIYWLWIWIRHMKPCHPASLRHRQPRLYSRLSEWSAYSRVVDRWLGLLLAGEPRVSRVVDGLLTHIKVFHCCKRPHLAVPLIRKLLPINLPVLNFNSTDT